MYGSLSASQGQGRHVVHALLAGARAGSARYSCCRHRCSPNGIGQPPQDTLLGVTRPLVLIDGVSAPHGGQELGGKVAAVAAALAPSHQAPLVRQLGLPVLLGSQLLQAVGQ